MSIPTIRTRATNVELTKEHSNLIRRHMAPLLRILKGGSHAEIDLVIRQSHAKSIGTMYVVSMKLTTVTDSYTVVASRPNLGRAVAAARDMIRRSISRGASVSPYTAKVQTARDAYTLTL